MGTIVRASKGLMMGNEHYYKDVWEEICFILSDNINSNISEKEFESQIVRVIEKLGWKEYKKEISRQLTVQIGRQGSLRPDLVIHGTNNEALVVLEVKRPLEDLSNKESISQLKSYIRQLKSEFGWLVGNEIGIYYDGILNPHSEPLLIDRIHFDKKSFAGISFVEIFEKGNFLSQNHKTYLENKIKKFSRQREIQKLKSIILSNNTKKNIIQFLEKEYADYGNDIFASVMKNIVIEITETRTDMAKQTSSQKQINSNKSKRKKIYSTATPNNSVTTNKTYTIEELENIDLGKETKPISLEIENDKFDVKNWTDLILKFVKWLIDNKKLSSSHVPLFNHSEKDKYFINTVKRHKISEKNAQWNQVGPYFVDTKYNAEAHKKNIIYTLNQLNLKKILVLRISFQ